MGIVRYRLRNASGTGEPAERVAKPAPPAAAREERLVPEEPAVPAQNPPTSPAGRDEPAAGLDWEGLEQAVAGCPGIRLEIKRLLLAEALKPQTTNAPLVAAVHGACVGGGMEYAIACDLVIASDKAVFGQPEVRLGFLPPYAAIRLPELIGPAKAIEVCTSGRVYPAAEARAMGFVSTVAAADAFAETVEKRIGEFKASSPLILRLNKRAVKQHCGMPFGQALSSVGDLFLNELMKTADTAEGIASFYEKRKPQWKNR